MSYLFVFEPQEQHCLSVLHRTACASGAHSTLGEGQLESCVFYSVLVPTCVTRSPSSNAHRPRSHARQDPFPHPKKPSYGKKQHQGKSEGSWKRDRSSVNVMPSGSIWHLSGFPSVLHKIISEDCNNNNKNLQQRLRAGEGVPLFLIYFALL